MFVTDDKSSITGKPASSSQTPFKLDGEGSAERCTYAAEVGDQASGLEKSQTSGCSQTV